jgi:hypothetical protein
LRRVRGARRFSGFRRRKIPLRSRLELKIRFFP